MRDVRRAWLELQRDLGGDEVILDRALDLGTPTEAAREQIRAAPLAPAVVAEKITRPVAKVSITDGAAALPRPAQRVYTRPAGPEPGWLKDAPSIPEPGLVVGAPATLQPWSTLDEIAAVVRTCPKCPLCTTRTLAVPGEGNPEADLMVVGEGPGESEDLSGRPFVGRAGELLDKMLLAIDTPRETVYIANIVKCRPPRNRVPLPDEREACIPYLHRQIALVRPRVILALGGTAAESLLGVKKALGELRLKVHEWNGIPLVVTYHPAALLRNPNWKRPAWDDVRIARQLLDSTT